MKLVIEYWLACMGAFCLSCWLMMKLVMWITKSFEIPEDTDLWPGGEHGDKDLHDK